MVIKHCFTDREAVGTVLALCLIFGMSRAAAGQSLPGQSSAMERLVPESSQHTFLKVDPTWVKQEEYLEPQGEESFRVVSRQRPDSKRRLFKQVSFFRIGAERDPSGYIKLVRYDPDGHLTQEVDQTPNARFERDFYPDGAEANYQYWHIGAGVVAGYSLDPHGKALARVQNGEGEQLSWMFGPDDYTHGWLHRGSYLMTRNYRNRLLVSETFWLPSGDNLRITASEERLTLSDRQEFWTKPTEGTPYGQVWPASAIDGKTGALVKQAGPSVPPDAIHTRLLERERNVRNLPRQDPVKEAEQSRQDYQARRAEFINRYTVFLGQADRKDLISNLAWYTHFADVAAWEFEREVARILDPATQARSLRAFFRAQTTPEARLAAIGLISNRYESVVPLTLRAELLEPMLTDADLNVRQSAVHALGFVANQNPTEAARLGKRFVALLHTDAPLRSATLMALGLSHRSEDATAVLPFLHDPSPAVRAEASFCLAMLTAPKTTYQKEIAPLLHDPDRNVRQRAISALVTMNPQQAEPYLEQMLEDPDAHIRMDVIQMLADSHAVRALPTLQRHRSDPDPQVRNAIEAAITVLSLPSKR